LIVEVRPGKEGFDLVTHSVAGEKVEGSVSVNGTFNFIGYQAK